MANSSTDTLEISSWNFETQRVRWQKHMVTPSRIEQTLRKNGFSCSSRTRNSGVLCPISDLLPPSLLPKAYACMHCAFHASAPWLPYILLCGNALLECSFLLDALSNSHLASKALFVVSSYSSFPGPSSRLLYYWE